MKKVFKILLSSFALFSLISCVDQSGNENSNSSIPQPVYYHVVFKNYDETVLSEIDVLEGTEAVYSGETPIRPDDDECAYTFIGWDKELTNIQSDLATIARYEANEKGGEGWGGIVYPD